MVSWLVEAEKNQISKQGSKDSSEHKDNEEEEEEEDEDFSDNYPFHERGQKDVENKLVESSKQGEKRGKSTGVQGAETPESKNCVEPEEKLTKSVHKEKEMSSMVLKIVEVVQPQEQMEVCLDSEEPSYVQSQNSEMLVDEFSGKESMTQGELKNDVDTLLQTKNIAIMPNQAERRSARNVGEGTPMLDRAIKVTANKNLQVDFAGDEGSKPEECVGGQAQGWDGALVI